MPNTLIHLKDKSKGKYAPQWDKFIFLEEDSSGHATTKVQGTIIKYNVGLQVDLFQFGTFLKRLTNGAITENSAPDDVHPYTHHGDDLQLLPINGAVIQHVGGLPILGISADARSRASCKYRSNIEMKIIYKLYDGKTENKTINSERMVVLNIHCMWKKISLETTLAQLQRFILEFNKQVASAVADLDSVTPDSMDPRTRICRISTPSIVAGDYSVVDESKPVFLRYTSLKRNAVRQIQSFWRAHHHLEPTAPTEDATNAVANGVDALNPSQP